MKRGALLLALLAALAPVAAAGAQAPLPLAPPPPDLVPLVPFAEAPGEKPSLAQAKLPLPAAPADLPTFPLAALAPPTADKPTATLAEPGALPCVGAFFGVASKALECGRARFARGEYEDAAKALEQAARSGSEREVVIEARYWLAETDYRLARIEEADRLFQQVAQTAPRGSEASFWSEFGSGWTAARLGNFGRARDTFTRLLGGSVGPTMEPWARHGLALADYALGRPDEAVAQWTAMTGKGVPPALARDVAFWFGEALGRTGEYKRAASELERFVQGGPHPLLDQGWFRLGWWGLQAGRGPVSVAAFRTFLTPTSPSAAPKVGSDRDWAEAGIVLALLPSDVAAAREAARDLESRGSALVLPLFVRVARSLVEAGRTAQAQAVLQDVLAANLTPSARAYSLLLNGEASRAQGNLDDARTQYDLAQRTEPGGATGWFAAFRLAQVNLRLREFAQASKDLAPVVAGAPTADARVAALLLQGEAAYHANDPAAASAAFTRVLVEAPDHAQAPAARLGVAWSALRQDRFDDARREFLDFARRYPNDPHTADALLLASELALKDPAQWTAARGLLDHIVGRFPTRSRTDFARLNRAILMLRTGDAAAARPELGDWIKRAPFPPLVGRAQAAMGVALLVLGQPVDAALAFTRARKEGVGALAALGLGVAHLAQGQGEPAKQLLTEARDGGTAPIAAVAEYGLAIVAFQGGAHTAWKKPALAALAAAPEGRAAPRLLYVLTAVAVEEKDWPGALGFARRLATAFPADEAADDGLARVGAGAAAAGVWPTAYDAYTELRSRFPTSPFIATGQLALAEAEVETGRAAEARRTLEAAVAAAPAGATPGRAWVLLARARQATGSRAGALEAYGRAAQGGTADWKVDDLLGYARLLVAERKGSDARAVLAGLLKSKNMTTVAEAAYGVGEAWRSEGEPLAAAEYYMTAAYVAPDSVAGRKALLGAAASFVAIKQPDAAAIVYRKLLGQAGVPSDLAEAARKGLKDLDR